MLVLWVSLIPGLYRPACRHGTPKKKLYCWFATSMPYCIGQILRYYDILEALPSTVIVGGRLNRPVLKVSRNKILSPQYQILSCPVIPVLLAVSRVFNQKNNNSWPRRPPSFAMQYLGETAAAPVGLPQPALGHGGIAAIAFFLDSFLHVLAALPCGLLRKQYCMIGLSLQL